MFAVDEASHHVGEIISSNRQRVAPPRVEIWNTTRLPYIMMSPTTDKRVRDYCLRTNIDLVLIGIIVAGYSYHVDGATAENTNTTTTQEDESQDEAAVDAVFFPWFAQLLGIVVYYVLSRYARAIPFTAMMFLIGLAIGAGVELSPNEQENVASGSASTWMQIPGNLILMIFLPGLLYVDSYAIDVHLFLKSFSQLFLFAFPMVLAGTSLTALVAYYIFPYQWPFDLCMTFGAILSATDPVVRSLILQMIFWIAE